MGRGWEWGLTDAVLYSLVAAIQACFLHSINSVLQEFMGIFLASKAEVPSYAYKVRVKTKLYHHMTCRAVLPLELHLMSIRWLENTR